MKTFSVKFEIGSLELDVLVTSSENNHKFKIEMVTGEPNPIILRYKEPGIWIVEHPGGRSLPGHGVTALCNAIEKYIETSQE